MSVQKRQMLILVDEHDNPTGEYADKGECHFGTGLHHRAFVVLLENKKGEVLLQKRKHVRWDNFWDVTAISHVLHFDDHDETYNKAALRALKDEMGISTGGVKLAHPPSVQLENIGGFNYFAKYHAHCENEYCALLVGKFYGKIKPNKKLMYDHRWMAKNDFLKEIKNNPEKYTPWAVLAVKQLRKLEARNTKSETMIK